MYKCGDSTKDVATNSDSTKDVATIKTAIQGRRSLTAVKSVSMKVVAVYEDSGLVKGVSIIKTGIQYSKPGVATIKIQ